MDYLIALLIRAISLGLASGRMTWHDARTTSKFGPYVDTPLPTYVPPTDAQRIAAAILAADINDVDYRAHLADRASAILPTTFESDPERAIAHLHALLTGDHAAILATMTDEERARLDELPTAPMVDKSAPFDDDCLASTQRPAIVLPATVKHQPNLIGQYRTYRKRVTVRDNDGHVDQFLTLTREADEILKHGVAYSERRTDIGTFVPFPTPRHWLRLPDHESYDLRLLGLQDQMFPEQGHDATLREYTKCHNAARNASARVASAERALERSVKPQTRTKRAEILKTRQNELQTALTALTYFDGGREIAANMVVGKLRPANLTSRNDLPRPDHKRTVVSTHATELAMTFRGRSIVGHRQSVALEGSRGVPTTRQGRADAPRKVDSIPTVDKVDLLATVEHALFAGRTSFAVRCEDSTYSVTTRGSQRRGFNVMRRTDGEPRKVTTATDHAYAMAALARLANVKR